MAIANYFASLNPLNLLGNIPAGIAQGLIWGIMAIGVYITFRILGIADLSVDGTFTTGAAVTVMLIIAGVPSWIAMIIAFICGLAAGTITGLLHTLLGIPAILAGILTQFAMYSINLAIMGMKANQAISVDKYNLIISSRHVASAILIVGIIAAVIIALLYRFFGTELGCAFRATGCNNAMAKAQGINIKLMKVIGLALSNAIVAFSGGLMAQYQGFSDINMGRGAIVIGLAAVIIGEVLGEAILKKHINFWIRLGFIVIGGILYYIFIIIVLWFKLDSNFLKLLQATIVAIFLAVPYIRSRRISSFKKAGRNAQKGGSGNA